jgi:hypothetical protein
MEKLFLGRVKKEIFNERKENLNLFISGESLWLEKHTWDCGWYWGFGYIGNKNLHTHAEIFIEELLWKNADEVFEKTKFNNNDFWVFKDLLKQAYSLKKTAEIYIHGGHCLEKEGVTDIIKSEEKAKTINDDLETVLDTMWKFLKDILNED